MGIANIQGGCVCKKVRYTITGSPLRVTICHCTWCQRRTGTAFGVEVVFNKEHIQFLSDTISGYRHISALSGRWVDQHFCNTCGSNIGLTLEAVPHIQSISVGSLDDQSWAELDRLDCRHVFVRSKRQWSELPNDVEQFEAHFRN